MIKAQWAWALVSARLHVCQPPKSVNAKLTGAELVGVYFGLYCNPLQDSVHKRLNRTLADILVEAPADGGRISASQLKELLELQQPGGNLGQRAVIWGTKQDMTDLLIFLKQARCGTVGEVQAMRRRCAQTALDALLEHSCNTLVDATRIDLEKWPTNALTLVENEAVLTTYEQLDALALLALLGSESRLIKRLPAATFTGRRLFACNGRKHTLVQWLLSPRDIFGKTEKLQFVLKHSVEPLW